jgi:ADP-ribose pyrophosphatase YjhB (NUDIX family)
MTQRSVTERWARFGPRDTRWFAHVPEDGVCRSVFVFVRNPTGAILLGRPRAHRDWPEKGCVPLWRLREVAGHGEWTLPASHLLMDEAPDAAARRVAADWAGLSRARPRLVTATSELMPTGRWTGKGRNRRPRNHWALCFLYELRTKRKPVRRPGWSELQFFSIPEAKTATLGRGHGDLLREYLRAGHR